MTNTGKFSGSSQGWSSTSRPNIETEDKGLFEFSLDYFNLLMKFDSLDFYGANANTFNVDGVVFEVLEDPNDDYRSSLGGIIVAKDNSEVFFRVPIAQVCLVEFEDGDSSLRNQDYYEFREDDCNGYQLIDITDGHIWLEFGTDLHDGYYPCFYFQYNPKRPKL